MASCNYNRAASNGHVTRSVSLRRDISETTSLLSSHRHMSVYPQDDIVDPDCRVAIGKAEAAIMEGIYPIRIIKGSSGSYFVRDTDLVSSKYGSIPHNLSIFRFILVSHLKGWSPLSRN